MTQAQALAILKTGANVFLTGEPGSGKTYTINKYVAYLRNCGIEPAITASTGIAATHIGGMTVHSWSGIGIKTALNKHDLHKIACNQYIVKRVHRAKVLIVEEVSMLTPEILSMIDTICREIKQSSDPFGGIQVVFSGDFFQLPPVVKKEVEDNTQIRIMEESQARFAYDSPAWKQLNPFICYLTEQYRQDDSDFLGLLSAIRRNSFGIAHLHHIEARKTESRTVPDNVPKLFSHNADVDRINDDVLGKLPDEPHTFTMSSQGPDALVTALIKGCLSPKSLSLKVGASVMFTKNNPKNGFNNGTLGTIVGFDTTKDYPVVRVQNGRLIAVEPMDWTMEENGKTRAQITQLPLRLAWAITVHKSQGMTLDKAVMDLSGVFEFGQGYVALSRIRRLSDLYILGWNDHAFRVHPDIVAKDKAFRLVSRDAETMFSTISASELQKKQDNFISACGGKIIPKDHADLQKDFGIPRPSLVRRWKHTLALILSGKTIAAVAKIRGRSEKKILEHLESLHLLGKLSAQDMIHLMSGSKHEIPKIHVAFGHLQSRQSDFEKIRETYPNAYRSWNKEQDEKLCKLFAGGSSIVDLAKKFGRKNGAIRSRLIKLGFLKNE